MYLVKYTKYSNVIMPIFSCYVVNFSLFEEMYGVRYGKRTVRYGTGTAKFQKYGTVRYGKNRVRSYTNCIIVQSTLRIE